MPAESAIDKAATVILFQFTLSIIQAIAEARAFKSFVMFSVYTHTFRRRRISLGKGFLFLFSSDL